MTWSEIDTRLMHRALELAGRAAGVTRPNPCVGAVIANADGRILGEGYHQRAGMPHAEVEALDDARRRGSEPRGATMYVTLEPCNHTGRTGPCSEAIAAAGIARVVVARRDPNVKARGGVERLRDAGVRVDVGLLSAEAFFLCPAFHLSHRLGRPMMTVKWAMTLDGCTAVSTGDSRWITGEAARHQVHRARLSHDAVLAGIGTVLRDEARLNARLSEEEHDALAPPGFQPLRIVLDSMLRLPADAPFVRIDDGSPALAVCIDTADRDREERLRAAGVEVLRLQRGPTGVSLPDLASHLHARGVQSVYIEGGRTVTGAFLHAGLADRVEAWIATRIAGGGPAPLGPTVFPAPLERMEQALALHHTAVTRYGDDLLIEGWMGDLGVSG